MTRQLSQMKPVALPLEEDLFILRQYSITQIEQFNDPYLHWSSTSYVQLRNLILTRLLLFNARRGEEPSRMNVSDWHNAKEVQWIPPAVQNIASVTDKQIIKKFKLAQLVGKSSIVPLLVPEDCWKGMDFLTDVEIRLQCGVNENNYYVFASTEDKESRARGWDAVASIINKVKYRLKLPNNITATKQRHRAATCYASLDISPVEEEAFLRHMGHSKDISQCH